MKPKFNLKGEIKKMLVTKPAPDFKATAVMGDNSFKDISISDYKGKKVVLFFYPLDFTFVCPTEILAFNHRLAEFEKRGVQVLGCSVDSKWSHLAWKNTDVKEGGIGQIQYPIIADIDKQVKEDIPIWEHKKYADKPVLCDKDGPIAQFRKHYSNFYAS